jgi:hypothetical protein
VRIRLGGLSVGEIGEFVRLTTGVEPTGELTAVVGDLTGLNAFLVTELWRELIDSAAVDVGAFGASLSRPATELGVPTIVIVGPDGKVAHHWARVKAKGHADAVREKLKELRAAA